MKGLFVTQASQEVGFGHLMECLAIAEGTNRVGESCFLLLDSNQEAHKLVRERGFSAAPFEFPSITEDRAWVFLNTRKNDFGLQEALFQKTKRLVVLDELGGIKLRCHALINFSINEEWHDYEFVGSSPKFYLGAAYYPLRRGMRKISGHDFNKGSVLVSLGGVDRSETVLRVAEALIKRTDISADFVLGPGCRVEEERLREIVMEGRGHRIMIAPDNFAELLAASEFVVSAGGNTLYEAAYFGKKTLIVWEDEHERSQGECFERAGLAKIVGGPSYMDEDLLGRVLDGEFEFSRDLEVDGKGVERICQVLLGN